MVRAKIVAGNWKMHGSKAMVSELIGQLNKQLAHATAEVVLCPPAIYLQSALAQISADVFSIGAQDACEHQQGAYTGQCSADMLADIGCRYVIVGHSERRTSNGESDEVVAQKFAHVKQASLVPILCVGEQLSEREENQTEVVIARQIDAVFNALGPQAFVNSVIAYEPVWAIGTGLAASAEQAQAVHAFIRAQVATKDAATADVLPLLYGGSVKPDNAAR
ncbi:MAG: triose-phosphate isomerase, partial [Candidatus Sericytochromatia bacterium]|nr:triose-phosphate isomerase [Candidatus Sericytochromatia bacterium]